MVLSICRSSVFLLADACGGLLIRTRSFVRLCAFVLVLLAMPWAPTARADGADVRILFINSYHRGYSWSDGIEDGLRERLEASGKKIELSIEYLDSRRFAYGTQIEPLAQAMEAKYANYRPDLIVVSDNAAFDFAIRYRERLFSGLPIVFCGFNNFRPQVIAGMSDITGVNEEVSIEDAVAMALKIHPRTRTLAFIVSTADASSKRIAEVAEQTVFPELRKRFDVVVLKDASIDEIRRALAALPKESLLFLSGQVSDQGAGRALTPAENGRLISAVSPFPAYTFWDFHLGSGVLGGHIITGPEQGRKAAEIALRVLDGTPADNIPVVMTTPTQDVFDYPVMARFGVSLTVLPAGASVIHRPLSLWDVYRWQIVAAASLMLLETLLIGLLLHVVRDRRKAVLALAQERALLERRVVQRTQELEAANAELARLSLTDSLTGLANRRRLDETLKYEFARLRRSGACLSLIILDVDHFKPFNDTYGHVAGDDCLRRVGVLIGTLVNRAPDLGARYGGEEFAVVLPETGADGAALMAERIRAGIEALAIPHRTSPASDRVTASLGVVTLDFSRHPTVSVDKAIALGDAQLYEAKKEGRNRVATMRPDQDGALGTP